MSKVSSSTSSSVFSKDVLTTPFGFAVLCFVSGLGAASVLGVLMPDTAEDDDTRSFVSFAVGAFICCFLQGKIVSPAPQKSGKASPRKDSVDAGMPPSRALASQTMQKIKSMGDASISPPPGLQQGRGCGAELRAPLSGTPPGLAARSRQVAPYHPKSFRRDVIGVMRDLGMHRNVGCAVQEVRLRSVPANRQAAELTDIVTFAMEESRGAIRRSYIAFIAGLAGVFEKVAFVDGMRNFFDDVYPGLCEEVPKLSKMTALEVLPTLRSVLSEDEMVACMPPDEIMLSIY